MITTDLDGRVANLNRGRRVAHRLARRGRAGAAARGGLSHRQRVDARAGREPGDARASRRRDRRPGQPHAADRQGRLARRRSTTARRRSATRRAGCTAASSSFATSASGRPPSASSARRRRACSASSPTWRSRPWSTPTTARSFSSTPPGPRSAATRAAELTTIPAWTRKAYGERAETMNAVIASLFDLEESVDNGEREITTASGEKRIWHFVTAPIGRDASGRRMLVTNAIDVTERRRLDAGARREGSAHAAGDGRGQLRRLGVGPRAAARWSGATRRASCSASAPTSRSASSCSSSASIPTTARARERAIADGLGDRRPQQRVPDRSARRRGALDVVARPRHARPRRQRAHARRHRRHHRAEEGAGRRSRTPTAGRTSSSPRSRTSCATRSRRCATRSRSCSAAPATRRPSTRRAA